MSAGKNVFKTRQLISFIKELFPDLYAQFNIFHLGNNVLRTRQLNAYIWVFLLTFIYATEYIYPLINMLRIQKHRVINKVE